MDFVVHYLPKDIASLLNVNSLEISKDFFIDKELEAHLSDLLYHVDLKGKGSVCVYLLFEHKSFVEPLICLQLLRYMTRIWEQWLKAGKGRPLPPIIPCNETVLRYVASGSDQIGRETIEESVKQVFEGQGGNIMPTIAEQWIEQGMQQEAMNLLSRQIARRFQVSSDSVHPMFAGLTTEQLEELGEKFLEAESLDEIRGWEEKKRLGKTQ